MVRDGLPTNPSGIICGQLKIDIEKRVETNTGDDIQQATIRLFKQTSFVRERQEDESITEFKEFLNLHGPELVDRRDRCK